MKNPKAGGQAGYTGYEFQIHATVFRESGSIYQPVYLGARDDIRSEECTTGQLKYRKQETAEEAA